MARPPILGTNASATYGTPAVSRPGMHSPCSERKASKRPKLGASAAPIVGGTRIVLASTIERFRPYRSENGPQIHAPQASASTTTEIDSPASAGRTPKDL